MRWEISGPLLLALMGCQLPLSTSLTIKWVNLSIQKTNKWGEMGSPWWIFLLGRENFRTVPVPQHIGPDTSDGVHHDVNDIWRETNVHEDLKNKTPRNATIGLSKVRLYRKETILASHLVHAMHRLLSHFNIFMDASSGNETCLKRRANISNIKIQLIHDHFGDHLVANITQGDGPKWIQPYLSWWKDKYLCH